MKRETRAGIPAKAILATLAILLAAPLAPARGNGRRPDLPVPQHFAVGDETIGTLPILNGPDVIDLRRDLPITRPSLYLEGDLADIWNSIVSVRGAAVARIEPVPGRAQRVRVIFPGQLEIGFDRLMVESSSITVGLLVPKGPRVGDLQAAWSTRVMTFAALSPYQQLPILAMSGSGALSHAPFLAHAHGLSGPTFLTAATTLDLLIVRQTH